MYVTDNFLIGFHRPTVKEFNHHVRDEVATRWHDLGVQLGISTAQLNIISTNNHENVQMCCTKMFEYWLNYDTKANWNKLIKALEDINHNALAKTIKEFLQGTQIFTHTYVVLCQLCIHTCACVIRALN